MAGIYDSPFTDEGVPAAVPAMSTTAHSMKASGQLRRLPLATLYLTERCNSRCVTCDYWRTGRADMTLDSVRRLLPSLVRLQTRMVFDFGRGAVGQPGMGRNRPAVG